MPQKRKKKKKLLEEQRRMKSQPKMEKKRKITMQTQVGRPREWDKKEGTVKAQQKWNGERLEE